MPRELLCRSIYSDRGLNMVECSCEEWIEILTPEEARKRAETLLFVAATASVEANAANALASELVHEQDTNAEKYAGFHAFLSIVRAGRGYEQLDGMSPIFGAITSQPLVAVSWPPGEPVNITIESAKYFAKHLFASAEAAETDSIMQKSCREAGIGNEILDRIFKIFSNYRQQDPP